MKDMECELGKTLRNHWTDAIPQLLTSPYLLWQNPMLQWNDMHCVFALLGCCLVGCPNTKTYQDGWLSSEPSMHHYRTLCWLYTVLLLFLWWAKETHLSITKEGFKTCFWNELIRHGLSSKACKSPLQDKHLIISVILWKCLLTHLNLNAGAIEWKVPHERVPQLWCKFSNVYSHKSVKSL